MPETQPELPEAYSLGEGSRKAYTNNHKCWETRYKQGVRLHLTVGSRVAAGINSSETMQSYFYLEYHSFFFFFLLLLLLFCFALEYRTGNKVHFRWAFEFKSMGPSACGSMCHREFQPRENPCLGDSLQGLNLLIQMLKPFLPVNSPGNVSSFIYQLYSKKL